MKIEPIWDKSDENRKLTFHNFKAAYKFSTTTEHACMHANHTLSKLSEIKVIKIENEEEEEKVHANFQIKKYTPWSEFPIV